jgi:diaminopimelate decarboxylase
VSEYDVGKRLGLFPISAEIEEAAGTERLTVAGHDLGDLAEKYGTPLYLYDLTTMHAALEAYREALAAFYPGEWGITYAGKAWLCVATAQWVHRQGLWLDCSGSGEMAVAAVGQVQREEIVLHGVNKGAADLASALSQAGTLVVDNLAELRRLIDAVQGSTAPLPKIWLRIRPGLAVATHAYTQTGQEDSKFGMGRSEVLEAVQICRQQGLPLTGLHFHQGSQFRDPTPIGPALNGVLDLMASLQAEGSWSPEVLCPGGGWAVAYHEDELPHPPIGEYVKFVAERVVEGCRSRGLALPRLQLEPGRSLVARAGLALYRVGLVKQTANRRWLLLDGGLTDNPRPALYGVRYSALPVAQPQRAEQGPAWLGGPHCESGDVLIEDLPLPEVQAGELIAVPMSGAYQLSMASNYNGARRPAVLLLTTTAAYLVQRREEMSDLIRRDIALEPVNL